LIALRVQFLFLFLALFVTIVFSASFYGFLPAVNLSAAKRAAKIIPTSITGMGEKKDLAMFATG